MTATQTQAAFDTVLAGHPDAAADLSAVHDAAWAAVEPELLELCRVRIAMLLGDEAGATSHLVAATVIEAIPEWPSSPRFSSAQRACLAFTEQFVIDVASMTDAQAEEVSAELGADGLANFANALLVVEQRHRLHLVWSRLFPEVIA